MASSRRSCNWIGLLLLLLALGSPLPAQHLAFGVKGGMPLNDLVETKGALEGMPSNWTLGPMLEVDLPFGLGIELDALYRRTGYSAGNSEHRASSWEFPLLGKIKLPGAGLRPYLAAGYSFRNIGDIPGLFDNTSQGFVVGGGVRINAVLFRLSPEIRYTRWNNAAFDIQTSNSYARGSKNQFEFLIGLTF